MYLLNRYMSFFWLHEWTKKCKFLLAPSITINSMEKNDNYSKIGKDIFNNWSVYCETTYVSLLLMIDDIMLRICKH